VKHLPYYNSVPSCGGDLIDVIAIHQEGYPLHLKLLSKSQSTQAGAYNDGIDTMKDEFVMLVEKHFILKSQQLSNFLEQRMPLLLWAPTGF
jgi:hypothetical protein